MKMILLILLIISPHLFGYNLLTGFLQPGNYTLEYGDELLKNENWNALNLSTGLTSTDITECINELYIELSQVEGKPTIGFSPTVNPTASCKITYELIPSDAIMNCRTTENSGYTEFLIRVNTKIRDDFSWYCEGGINSSINLRSVLKHELGHALGLYENFDNPEVLMYYEHDVAGIVTTIDLTPKNDDINGFKAVYEKSKVRVVSPHTFNNDTVTVFKSVDTVDIEFEVKTPSMLEYNSITPHLKPVGFFTEDDDFYTGYDAVFDSLGNDLYRFKTNIDNFIEENGTDLQKFHTLIERDSWQFLKYESEHSPDSALVFEIKAVPKILELEDMYFLPPSSEKGAVSDTIEVKIAVPEISGSYPAIKLKIDDVYVDQGDIVFEDNLWVYYWDLVDVTSEITGKRFKIEAELFDDPKCKNESGVMIVEALYYEDFEAFNGVGWEIYNHEEPILLYYGWFIYPDQINNENTTLSSITQGSYSLQYQIWSPPIEIPDSSDFETSLDYSVYFEKSNASNYSNLYFLITDENNNVLTMAEKLYPDDNDWTNYTYDLSEFYGQTIKFRWDHLYNSFEHIPCEDTIFGIDSLLVYVTPPDINQPMIDYITGNQANVDEDMNINLAFNDASDIVSVTADYNIEGASETITLSTSKNSYNYTGLISARDHVCDGDIKFRVEDEVGNTIISDRYSISWSDSGVTQTPSTPSNLIITAENDSTVALTWSIVAGASEYKVYASEDPYGTFILDTLGTFISGTHWQKDIGMNKMFYRITAGNTSKMFFPENNTKPEKVDIEKNLIFIEPKRRRK